MDFLPTVHNTPVQQQACCHFTLKVKSVGPGQQGFTLLEVLAVVLIIGIIVSFATLSIGQNTSQVIQDEAERLNGLLRLANEEAVMQGRELALEFSEEAYSFLELNIENQWAPVSEDDLFRERTLPPNVKLELIIEGAPVSFEDKKNLPRIFVLSSGELTPFSLTLSTDEGESYTLQGAIDGKLVLTNAMEGSIDV